MDEKVLYVGLFSGYHVALQSKHFLLGVGDMSSEKCLKQLIMMIICNYNIIINNYIVPTDISDHLEAELEPEYYNARTDDMNLTA